MSETYGGICPEKDTMYRWEKKVQRDWQHRVLHFSSKQTSFIQLENLGRQSLIQLTRNCTGEGYIYGEQLMNQASLASTIELKHQETQLRCLDDQNETITEDLLLRTKPGCIPIILQIECGLLNEKRHQLVQDAQDPLVVKMEDENYSRLKGTQFKTEEECVERAYKILLEIPKQKLKDAFNNWLERAWWVNQNSGAYYLY
ncbi:MAG: hypothetical protein EZS28_015620 [Streblomastix strix]|uniref:Uncharacterized protein n=1 Tax=Streblomastix strix TaxID=222440 RepID=A0A5J4W2C1_9EUKA|nr:MAG: hypothetical protein EZS28_015620 [Streblomastix strix]